VGGKTELKNSVRRRVLKASGGLYGGQAIKEKKISRQEATSAITSLKPSDKNMKKRRKLLNGKGMLKREQ